jgi:mannosyltransferase OCH1-like enzyme
VEDGVTKHQTNNDDDEDFCNNREVRYFGDRACHSYISKYYDTELVGMFDAATPGYYRGDICRAAVLYREGGYYMDVDVQLIGPVSRLVEASTTFMSVYSIFGDVFNGLLAAEPQSEILGETLQMIRKWYRGEIPRECHQGLMGTRTMHCALKKIMKKTCPSVSLATMKQSQLQWECGQHNIRMYREGNLDCTVAPGCHNPLSVHHKGEMAKFY